LSFFLSLFFFFFLYSKKMGNHYLGLKLLCIFSIGCIGSGQMFLPLFYKKVLGLGNDKIGFIYSISNVFLYHCICIFLIYSNYKKKSTFCFFSCLSLLDLHCGSS
jgi:hypothetical protein